MEEKPLDQEDKQVFEKIDGDRRWAHEELGRRGSKVYKAFLKMEEAAYSDGALDKKYKELIAVGISVVINCESCMQWHIRQALRAGATEKQVLEAVEVGIEMGGGPATVSSRFALKVLEHYGTGKEGLLNKENPSNKENP
jgi:AhpD family alkylhydroperoxidase